MSRTAVPTRGRRLFRMLAAFGVLLGLAGYLLVHHLSARGPGAPGCRVTAGGDGADPYELGLSQARNAATIAAVGSSQGLPERAITIALATAMQESSLHNLDHGDRDSLGLFQQRPSQGWGEPEQIMDPVYSAGKFYEHLVEVPGYSRLPLTVAAQKVQRSGYPQAYAKHEPNAALLARALTGRSGASLNCTPGQGEDAVGDTGKVRAALHREFGAALPAGFENETGGKRASSRVTVPVTGRSGAEAERRGWAVAHWAVAHSVELRIAEVSYAGRVWSASEAGAGWRRVDEDAAREVVLSTVR
ncbi:hypothetical protein [Streptomyces sp. TP-A0874]|uniref:hypothetical protein n=1 Tax=Streptomyces sp. TP-A0874 TaxID=549819 RepID=UPI001FCD607D|nr:hypothetical protein [Streptomyces sp. TP-A0874]